MTIVFGFILLAFLETLNGVFRVRFLFRKLSKKGAKLLSFLIGLVLVFIVNLLYLPLVNPTSKEEAFFVGFTWGLLMMIYDVFVGKFLFKLSWEKIADDFDITKGNLLSIGIVLIVFMPVLVFKYIF